ncbi:MAG: hypothetical protein LQ351_000271 [Letrouitia transgressa]|nr:MAG: hypothetical protein LQ351_000271 [Letrouitia transgressa]
MGFLRHRFGESEFHVTLSNDEYRMELPRALIEEETAQLLNLRVLHGAIERSESPHNLRSEHSVEEKAHLGARERESSIPLIKASREVFFEIPSKDGKSDTKQVYSVSDLQVDARGASSSLYRAMVSQGFTSDVYAVDARWSWVQAEPTVDRNFSGKKVAIKRLSQATKLEEFIQEYDALKLVTRSRHRNIVDFLNAFRYEDANKVVHYNFSFPLAAGNLKQLFHSSPTYQHRDSNAAKNNRVPEQFTDNFHSIAMERLWSEFEGLANALVYLHDYCHIVHSDIKPSNILLYESYGSEAVIIAKLTDFGMAVDLQTKTSWRLGSKEAQSAWQYDAPEIRAYYRRDQLSASQMLTAHSILKPKTSELKSGDVWKLGSVFVELLTFLVKGSLGVSQFQKHITTTHRELTSDDISDTRFDDGKRVKAEVLEWLSQLARMDLRAQEIEVLLVSMLSMDTTRPSALEVSQALKESSICLHFDGMRYLNFTPSRLVRSPCAVDQYKELVEKWLGHCVDWRPLKNGYRTCSPGFSRISWLWSKKHLYIDVPESLAEAYKQTCRPVSCFTQPVSYPYAPNYPYPAYNSSQGDFSQIGIDLSSLGKEPTLHQLPSGFQNRDRPPDPSTASFPVVNTQHIQNVRKEIYWCVDQAWSEPRITKLCLLQERPRISDDTSLCEHLLREYNRVRKWKGRFLSWKSCLGVEFIKFSRLDQDDAVVKIRVGLPPSDSQLYEYVLKRPEEVHMMIAATQLIDGLHHPKRRNGGDDRTLRMIPKRIVDQSGPDVEPEDWGIYARSRFSLWKIMAWIATLTILGLVFVIYWLTTISKTDLQNAVVPYTFFATTIIIGLGVPQFLDVD